MNIDAWMPESIIYECVVGSRAYGLETPDSDYDYRGFCIPPTFYFFGPDRFEQKDKAWADGADRVIWNLTKGVDLLLNANPNMLELLFVPDGLVIHTTPYWEAIREIRPAFLSKRVKSTYLGYADSQWGRMKADLGGPLRPKYASHLLRLLFQGAELLETGELSIRLSGDALSICRDVKNGLVDSGEVLRLADHLIDVLKSAAQSSDLPPEPDRKKAYDVMRHVIGEYLGVR